MLDGKSTQNGCGGTMAAEIRNRFATMVRFTAFGLVVCFCFVAITGCDGKNKKEPEKKQANIDKFAGEQKLAIAKSESLRTPPSPKLATMGTTGLLYEDSTGTLRLVQNLLTHLAMKHGRVPDRIRMLYTSDCDPRKDAEICRLASSLHSLGPFFRMVRTIGEVEFADPGTVDLSSYDVVIADFCKLACGHVEGLATYLESGGRALVLGSNSCGSSRTRTSASCANELIKRFGISFTRDGPNDRGEVSVPPSQRTGVLTGVTSISRFRVATQIVKPPYEALVSDASGRSLVAYLPMERGTADAVFAEGGIPAPTRSEARCAEASNAVSPYLFVFDLKIVDCSNGRLKTEAEGTGMGDWSRGEVLHLDLISVERRGDRGDQEVTFRVVEKNKRFRCHYGSCGRL